MTRIITTTAGNQIYEIIKQSIISGTMEPGLRIVEEELAIRYDISRTPLREALLRLEQDGLLVRLHKRGLAVSPVSSEEAEQLSVVRSYIEGLAARLATEHLTDLQVKELKAMRDSIDVEKIKGDADAMKSFGSRLHGFIKNNCHNKFCEANLSKLQPLVTRYKNINVERPGRRIESLKEHLAILDYMIERDAIGAENAMRKHTEVSLNGSIELIRSGSAL